MPFCGSYTQPLQRNKVRWEYRSRFREKEREMFWSHSMVIASIFLKFINQELKLIEILLYWGYLGQYKKAMKGPLAQYHLASASSYLGDTEQCIFLRGKTITKAILLILDKN